MKWIVLEDKFRLYCPDHFSIKTKERISSFQPICDAGGRDERCGDLPTEEGQDRDQEDGRL